MISLRQQLHDTLSSVTASHDVLSVSGIPPASAHIPLPCVEISGVGDLSLPLTEARALAVHPSISSTHAHIAHNEPNFTAFRSSHLSVNPHFDAALQLVAQHHCRHLGVRTITQEGATSTSAPPRPVVATLRSLVIVWSSNSQCVVPDVHTDTLLDSNKIGCLLLQMPALYQGGQLSFQNKCEGGKVEARDMSARSKDLFQATSFYTDGVSHSIAPVTSGVMTFLVYDLLPTATCGHVPSPMGSVRLKAKMLQLVTQWVHEQNASEMYAFALRSKTQSIGDLLKDMPDEDRSRVELLKNCGNVGVFVVVMSKIERGPPVDEYNDDDFDCEASSEIGEVEEVEFESAWYTLEKDIVAVDNAHNKSVKDRHMLGESNVFQGHRDHSEVEEYSEHTFYRNVVVFCPKKRLAHMALSLSLETATNFVEASFCEYDDLMQAMHQYSGPRRGRADSWVEMTKRALFHKQKSDVVSLLKLLNNWQSSRGNKRGAHSDGDEQCETEDEADSAFVLQSIEIVKAIVQIASCYGNDEAVVSSIAQLADNVDRRDIKHCVQLIQALFPVQSSSSSTQSDSPSGNVADRLASACLRKVMALKDIGSELVTSTLNITFQNVSALPSTYKLRYDLVSSFVSRCTPPSQTQTHYFYSSPMPKHPACTVLQHPVIQRDLSLTKIAVQSMKLDHWDDSHSIVDTLYALLQSFQWTQLGESLLQCAQHSSVACLMLSLRMTTIYMHKEAAILATESLRHLPANAMSPRMSRSTSAALTVDVICDFVTHRYLRGDVIYNSSEPGLWEAFEKWLLTKCSIEGRVMTALGAVVHAGFKQGTLSLLRTMSGVTAKEIATSICESVDVFGWTDLSEAVLKLVRCTPTSSLHWTMSLVSHFDSRSGTPNNNISVSIGACIVQVVCETPHPILPRQVRDVARVAFRLTDDEYRLAKQFAVTVFNTKQSAITMPMLLEKASECATGEVAIYVLSFFDKPMYTGESVTTQDLDSDEIVINYESVCGIFNDNVSAQIWAVLQAVGGEHADLNQLIAKLVRNTSVVHVDLCGKLARCLWAGAMTAAKWKSEQLRRFVVHDILDVSIRTFRSVKSNGRDCEHLLTACLEAQEHQLFAQLRERWNQFNVKCIGIVIAYDFKLLASFTHSQNAQLVHETNEIMIRLTSCIQHFFQVLVSSVTEQATMNVNQVIDITNWAIKFQVSDTVIDTIVNGAIDLNAAHAKQRKKEVLLKLVENPTVRSVFGPVRTARVAQSLKVCIEQEFSKAQQDFSISLHLRPSYNTGTTAFAGVRRFLESSSLSDLAVTVNDNFRSISDARKFERTVQAMIINKGSGISIASCSSGTGRRACVTLKKTGPNVNKLRSVQLVSRAELARVLPIINASSIP